MADEIASLGFKVDSSGLVKADQRLDKVTESGKRTERQNDMTSDSFNRMSKAVGVAAAALAGLGVGFNVIDDVVNFDRALTELQATSRASAADVQRLEMQSRALGATTQFSATQVAEAQRFLAQAGFQVNEILNSTSQTLKLATAGNLDVAEAADIASNAMGGMGLAVSDLSMIVDVMAEAASASNTDVRQLASALSNAAPVATAAGVSLEELTASIGTLSDSGIQAERAGTAMVGIIRQLSNVTPAAQEILKKYGLTIDDVNVQTVGLANAMRAIGQANVSSGEAIKIFGSEAAAAGLVLSSMTEKLEEQTLRFQQSAGSADEMASIMNSSLINAAKGLGSALSEVSLIAGDNGLNGVMKSLIVNATGFTHVYTGMLDEFTESSGLTQEFATNMRSASEAMEAMIAVMGAGALIKFAPIMYTSAASTALTAKNMLTMNAATYKTTAGFAGLGGTVTRTSAAMTAFGAASRFALGPWGLLITAVGAAAATFISTKNEAESLTDAIDAQAKAVRKMVKDYGEMNSLGRQSFWTKSNQQIGDLLTRMTEVDRQISGLRASMSDVDSGTRQDLKAQIEQLKQERENIESAYEQIKEAQQRIFEGGMPDEWQSLESGDSGIKETTQEVNEQIRALKQLQAEIGMTSDELFVYRQQQKAIAQEKGALDQVTALSNAIVQARRNLKFDEQISELSALQEQVGKTSDELFVLNQVTSAKEAGFSDKQIKRVREMAESLVDLRKAADEASEYERWVESVNNSHRSISDMTAEINKLKEAIEMGDIEPEAGKAAIKEIREEMDRLTESKSLSEMFADGMSAAQQGAMAMREFAEQGTKEYERLTRAAQAFGVAQSLATGNYLGALAGAASIISSLGSYDFKDISAEVQANQNLNVWGEKSESIDRSTEITANATEKLVGINTDMLKSFQSMNNTIAKAAGILSRDVSTPQVDIGGLGIIDNVFSFLTDNSVFEAFNKITLGIFGGVFNAIGGWLGGSSKVVDEGIRIIGGSFTDMMEQVMVQGYQVVKYKKWRFGSTKTANNVTDISSEVGGEIAQIFTYMGDAISSGLESLNVHPETIRQFFDEFELETERLSLKGLSAAQQKEELEAYFNDAFDDLVAGFDRAQTGLAGIFSGMQRVGESLGETFTRAVTQTQILEQAVKDFNLNFGTPINELEEPTTREELIDFANMQRNFVLAADEMASLTGGLDSFIEKLNGFSSFASDATNLEILGGRLESRFASLNMELPDTADALWEMIQGIDGTTEAGREQIATILNLQDSAKAYYQLLERENQRILDEKKSQLSDELSLEKERINELNSGLQEQISLLNERKQKLEENLSTAQSLVESAYSREIERIREVSRERLDQLNAEKSAVRDSVSNLSSIINSAMGAVESVYSTQSRNAFNLDQALQAARAGDFSGAASVDFSGAFADSSGFSTRAGFEREQAKTALKIQELSQLAGAQKTIEEMTLNAIERQIESTNSGTERQIDQLEQQKNALLGLNQTQLSISAATMEYRNAKRELDELNYDAQLNYYEEQIKANNDEYELLKTAYDKQIELLEESNNIDEYYYKQLTGEAGNDRELGAIGNNPPPPQQIRTDEQTTKQLSKLRAENKDMQAQLMRITANMASDISDLRRIEVSKEEIQ